MVAYLIAEWREWESKRLGPSLLLFCLAGLAGLAYAYLEPFLMGAAGTAASILAGWVSSNRCKPGSGPRRIMEASGLGPLALAGGACIVSAAAFALCALALSPALALVAASWDIGAASMASLLALWLGAFLVAASASFLSSLLFGNMDHFVGAYALGAWMLPSAFWAPARAVNPFVQSWASLGRGLPGPALACAAAELAAASLLLAASLPALRSLGKEEHD